ncbi:MAG: bifunctional phosphopantothenoylcysteine decarboxylase/phosphopantothenate--cysteine ligase CoaBC [Flavobacteriaceae bacterium]|jgi:phosphopantothenoylcysteine decarboxylase/phosphopantothenate--cysteine ligase|nr:bifunctional phosphopantothenoylcysteine decarboxylase/phosphopantothenate--cysteine ligase CoaBC [Flavobacteriaceae bacterium]
MSILNRKKVLLAVTAGIAAYKTAFLVRLFIKEGAEVKVILTPKAREFVTPLTLSTLSKNPVEWDFSEESGTWNNHVELGLWADFMVVAPATANSLSKMADGSSDNLLLATYLSAKCPVYIAPAMDLDMYQHPTTKENLTKLESFGNIIIPAESGELASGLRGEGRMAEPENILSFIANDLQKKAPLFGKSVLISAGPTYEKMDPVRFIGNFSSGKMGIEIAKSAANLGADVILVCGPSSISTSNYNIKRIDVVSAMEMKEAMDSRFENSDIVIMSAAVADYRPAELAEQKIKKDDETMSIEMIKNPDILKALGERKKHQILVGFALETNNELEFAKGKLQKKNLDFIVLNSMRDEKAGFQKDTNKVTIIPKKGEPIAYEAKNKAEVAKDIINFILENYEL